MPSNDSGARIARVRPPGDRSELFLAKLRGFKDMPGSADPDGSGKAYTTLVGNRACWVLNWFGIGAPTAAHIHIGRPAQAVLQPVLHPGERLASVGARQHGARP